MKKQFNIKTFSYALMAMLVSSATAIAQPTTYGTGAGTGGNASSTYLGYFSGASNTGDYNTFTGAYSGNANVTGTHNTFMGYTAGSGNTSGYSNTCLGMSAGSGNSTGNNNVYIGQAAGYQCTGSGNTYVGAVSGPAPSTGNNNTILGYLATCINSPTNATAIGYGTFATTSNTVILGNSDAKVGIGTSTPSEKLMVSTSASNDGIRVTQTTTGFAGIRLENQSTGGKQWGLLSLGATNSQGPGNFLIYNYSGGGSTFLIDGSNGNVGIGIGTAPPSTYKLYVNGNTHTTGLYSSSDRRFKNDIKPVQNAMELISSLEGVRYTFKNDMYYPQPKESTEAPVKRNFPTGTQIGLIAQDVEKVLPEVVNTDEDGYKAIAYQNIVPLLIEGMKEQQKQINDKDKTIETLMTKLDALNKRMDKLESNAGLRGNETFGKASLEQNAPNPFSTQTTIGYYLPAETTGEAALVIYSTTGSTVQRFELTQKGKGQIVLQGLTLQPGTYVYSLEINGSRADSKKMVLTADRN